MLQIFDAKNFVQVSATSFRCNIRERVSGVLEIFGQRHMLSAACPVHPVLLASGSHYIGYQLDNVLFTKPL